jgi:hypothetical protein
MVLAGVAIAGWLIVGFIVHRALLSGEVSGTSQAAEFAAALIAALAAAAALRWDDAIARCAIVTGGVLVSIALVLGEASPATNDAAALPLASAGFYLLLLGAVVAAVKTVAGIRQGHR